MMTDKRLLALYGLKYNPFLTNIPTENLWKPPGFELFAARLETVVHRGGFCLICGESGLGKSKLLQILDHRFDNMADVVVGAMTRPQSTLSDFYRELGELFGVNLSVANRYGSFKTLRERWQNHISNTLLRPVLLVDEAQEVPADCLNELRLLGSIRFDSQCLLTTVLAGDQRLPERFRTPELMALGSRIRARLNLEPYDSQELRDFLEYNLEQAGAAHLMNDELKNTLAEHAAGNPRLMNNIAAELLDAGAERELPSLDEKLFLEIFTHKPKRRKASYKGSP